MESVYGKSTCEDEHLPVSFKAVHRSSYHEFESNDL